MDNPLEISAAAPPPAKPEHSWMDSIAETWHAGLRKVGLEEEPKHLEMKKFDFAALDHEFKKGAYLQNMEYMSMSEPCRREMYSKALHTHLDVSCISEVIKHGSDKK
jgi:hypothetical protein